MENDSLLLQKPKPEQISSGDDEWGEGSSSTSSYSHSSYSDISQDSYIANWENHICSDGSLFFAEYSIPSTGSVPAGSAMNVIKNDFSRASTRRSAKKATSKLSRLVGKREKKEESRANPQQGSVVGATGGGESSKVTFCEGTQGEVKEVEAMINPEWRFKFGRRATATESILGISTSPFSDGSRLMVAGHISNPEINLDKFVKIGDWLKAINEIEVTAQNIEEVIGKFTKPTKVLVKFQRIAGEEQIIPTSNTIQTVANFVEFANSAKQLLQNQVPSDGSHEVVMPFSLMILTLDFSDADIEANDVLFCYPPKENNILFGVRGSFLTLYSILKAELNTEPVVTTVEIKGVEYHISYHSYNKMIVLFSMSSKHATPKEVRFRLTEWTHYFQFCYLSFIIPLSEIIKSEIELLCKVLDARLTSNKQSPSFENILQESHLIPLPKEAQLRIYDALSEMEAMDYRDWNDEPLNSHREFFMFGSVLYFKSYLLASHLPASQLAGVESFLRNRGIFSFIEQQNVRDLIVWLEIPMMSSTSRYFLALASRNQLLLAVILQSFEPERRLSDEGKIEEKIIGPSLFYIEEIQETLDHLRHGGIEALARVWVTSNKRPEVVKESANSSAISTVSPKKTEVVSILKHRSTSSEDIRVSSSMGGSSVHSLTHSEDSNQKLDECDSDSDWEGFPDSHKSSSGFDMSEMKESFLKEISDILPSRITTGRENILFHYVQLDVGTGMVLSPPGVGSGPVINAFRNACHVIHTVLQNTKKFRRLLSQESTKPNTHKSLVAIKEHGVQISVETGTNIETNFWVIGRLFTSPTRELYVCHRSDIPQNLVEIAFRLSFLTSG